MKNIPKTQYLNTEASSASQLLFGQECNEKNIEEDYKTKNLNEECQQTSKRGSC